MKLLNKQWIQCKGYFSNGILSKETFIKIEDGVFTEILAQKPQVEKDSILKLNGYILPLLSDTHCHVYMNPWPFQSKDRVPPGSKDILVETEDATTRLREALNAGIGFVRDMGDPFGINIAVKKNVLKNPNAFPEFFCPGPALHRKGKYGRYLGISYETLEELHELTDDLLNNPSVDFIKISASGIVDFKEKRVRQKPQFEGEELKVLVNKIHERGKKVSAHCSGIEALEACAKAGVDFIEHGYFINPELIEKLASQHQIWTPTFIPVAIQLRNAEMAGWDESTQKSLREIIADHAASLCEADRKGLIILTGSDAGSPGVSIGKGTWDELIQMQNAGLPILKILSMSTIDAAKYCDSRAYSGKIEVDHSADFAIYEKAPWEDLEHLKTLRSVYKKGQDVTN